MTSSVSFARFVPDSYPPKGYAFHIGRPLGRHHMGEVALPARLAEGFECIGIDAVAGVYEQARDMTYGLYAAYTAWGPIGVVVRCLRSTDEPLARLLDVFEDMHRGPAEVITRYLAEGQLDGDWVPVSLCSQPHASSPLLWAVLPLIAPT